RDRPRGEGDADQPAADRRAPPPAGQARRTHEDGREHQLERQRPGRVHLLSGCVSMPASRRAWRTASATRPAPFVSPWTQIVSTLPDRARLTACSAANGGRRTPPPPP